MKKEKILAMLLAGGQGTRLLTLTKDIAKPAVPFGGKYRIIDFPLSNAANSGVGDIGILTQYKPLQLNEHIGNGSHWDLDRNVGGLRILSPYTNEAGGRWYKGTANAIYENIGFIDNLNPMYVLVLSGDHIYKMDYRIMLKYHKEKESAATLSVIEVPKEDISRFGILETDGNDRIEKFLEKPKEAKSRLASMGVYIFDWPVLRRYLIDDMDNPESDNDFGKNIVPAMLMDGIDMYAYKFQDYWKDVGTVASYWEANMDLLNEDNTLDLYDKSWRIFTKNRNLPPQYIADTAEVHNSMINEGCMIQGHLEHCVLFSEVSIQRNASAYNSVILSDATIEEGAQVCNAVVMEGVTVRKGQKIGEKNSNKVYLVSKNCKIEEIER